jgi:chitin-binding protein
LCSGGLPAYRGLDLARADWPSTRLTPGAAMTMRYVSTIPHTGTFRLYLTKPGYDPSKPLTWSDLPEKPFAEVTDPALTDGAYRLRANLPSDRTGRHVLYTIWQNSSTPDTYYSCSDVEFPAAESAAAEGAGSARADGGKDGASASPSSPEKTAKPEKKAGQKSAAPAAAPSATPSGAAGAQAGTAPDSTPVASAADSGSSPSAPVLAGGAAAMLVLSGGAALALRLRRR